MKGLQDIRFSRINTDANNHDIRSDEGEYRMIENMVPPQAGVGVGFSREAIPGTTEITSTLTGTHKVIGSFEDAPNNKCYFFVWEESGSPRKDKIYAYDAETKSIELILDSEYLGWTEDLIITGISVINGVIYWTDFEMRYFRIQDNSQLIEINYYARAITDTSTVDYYFQAASIDGAVTININVPVTGPLSASEVLQSIADQFNANGSFNSYFTAVKVTDSEVIKITSDSKTGNWLLTGNSASTRYYYSTNYDPVIESSYDLLLYPTGPWSNPVIEPTYDSSIPTNFIADKNWQFAYRYIYTNDQSSVFSPYSEIYPASKFPDQKVNANAINALDVYIPIYTDTEKFKAIELAVRTSQQGDFFIVKVFDRSELFKADVFSSSSSIYYKFTGTELQEPIATADIVKQEEGIPRESNDLVYVKNKLFAIENLVGFNVNAGDFSMDIEVEKNSINLAWPRWFKDGGRKMFGMRFFDAQMRTDGTVHKTTLVEFENEGYAGTGKLLNNRKRIKITLGGKPPIWAHYWSFVQSEELYFGDFIQVPLYIHYWVRPMEDDETYDDFASSTQYYAMWGQVYLRPDQDQNNALLWKYVHLQMPTNMGYSVDKGTVIHLNANFPLDPYMSAIDIIGPMIVLDKPPNSTIFSNAMTLGWFELFNQRTSVSEESFYEINNVRSITNPGEFNRRFDFLDTTPTYILYGDCYYVNNIYGLDGLEDKRLSWKYNFENYTTDGSDDDDKGLVEDYFVSGNFESWSPSFRPTKTELTELSEENTVSKILQNANIIRSYDTYEYDFGYVNDHSYDNQNLGRAAVLFRNAKEESRPSTIRWSNDYVENAFINGLHTWEPLNNKPLPIERGPIIKLQTAGEDVLLAIHSSAVTSLYIGKGVIRSADLNPTLVTTDGVIGSENQLKYSFGTVHPESVSEVDGNVYFWDGRRNEPVRYAQNGLTPIATTFLTRVLFRKTIPGLFGGPSNYKCISEYDRHLEIVWFTFINDSNSYTIGFSEKNKGWVCKASFAPEFYGAVGDYLLGFVNGKPWLHNDDTSNYNNFYGVQYDSTIHVVGNIGDKNEKSWDNMYVDSNVIWTVPEISNEEGQLTDLVENDFVWRDNIFYADILRDKNTNTNLLKPGQIALRHGKIITGQNIEVKLKYTGNGFHYIDGLGIGVVIKPGHFLARKS